MILCDTCDNRGQDPDSEPCNSCLSLLRVGKAYKRTDAKPERTPSAWEKSWVRWAKAK